MNNNLLINNWHNCLIEIEKHISKEEFAKWIQPIEVSSFDGATLLLSVPSSEWAEHIEKYFLNSIKQILKKEFQGIKSLRYALNPSTKEQMKDIAGKLPNFNVQHNTQAIQNPFIVPGLKKVMIDPQLNFELDFDSFIGGGCNRLAREIGLAVSKKPGEAAFNPMFIHGDSGLGKTHLVQAIGIEVKKTHPDLIVLYVSTNKFLDQFTTATRKKEINNFVRFYQLVDVLILDDVQELAGKPGTQVVLFNIFNHLQLTGKQLIFTCDKSPNELKDIENRLITRFKWGITVSIDVPDYATKIKIIESKAKKLNLQLPDEVIDYMAKNIVASVREIEGAISSFVAYSSLLNREPSLGLAKEIIKGYVHVEESREVTIDSVQGAICDFYKISKSDFFSSKRTRDIAFARQLAMYLCKELTTMSLKSIGQAVGGKTHATVLHACKTITNRIETNKDFQAELDKIKSVII